MYIYIRSMSESQIEVYRKLVASGDQIVMHITKLMLFPDCSYVDHWQHEVWAFLSRISKLKGKSKFPKKEFIKRALATHNDTLEGYIAIAKDEESKLTPRKISEADLLACIEQYQDWLASKLSTDGYVIQSEAKNKLSEICK